MFNTIVQRGVGFMLIAIIVYLLLRLIVFRPRKGKAKGVGRESFELKIYSIKEHCSDYSLKEFMNFLDKYKGGQNVRKNGHTVREFTTKEKAELQNLFYNVVAPAKDVSIAMKEQFRNYICNLKVDGVDMRPRYEDYTKNITDRHYEEKDKVVSYFADNTTNGYKMISNISDVNKPNLQLYSPYTFEIETNGSISNVSVNSPILNSNAEVELNITLPNGTLLTKYLSFDSEKYITSFDCDLVGTYLLNLKYRIGATEYESSSQIVISYLPEYDSFEYYDASNLYTLVTKGGMVSEDGNLKLVNDDSFILTYKYEFAPLLMILSCVLFVVDIAIRKLRWQDIKDIFKKKQRRA